MKRKLLVKLGHSDQALASAWTEFEEFPCKLAYDQLMKYAPKGERALAKVYRALGMRIPNSKKSRDYDSALAEFHGLSPEQMHRLLNFPFTSPQLVRFPETLGSGPKAPILTLFELLVGAIGEQGLKPAVRFQVSG